jgi:TolB-like protein
MRPHSSTLAFRLALLILLSFALGGCSSFNCTPLEKHLGGEENLITLAKYITNGLTDQAFPPLMPMQPDLPILVTTFVNNENLKETSRFSRVLQEHITSRLVQLHYTAKEIKLRETLLMQEQSGETMLSRNLQETQTGQSLSAQAILVGTYSYTNRVMYISARLVNPKNRNIISSYDYRLCMDDNVLAMFGLKRQPSGINTVSGDEVDPPRGSLIDFLFY